jgi:inhibitor of KinA sporulation pathway (predicted exonuclease)
VNNYYLVVDLEATCADDGSMPADAMEIIEIGACWTDGEGNAIDSFQCFVRPVDRPQLTPFCTELTKIRQTDIDTAPLFLAAAESLRHFADRHRKTGSVWLSWGAYDRKQIDRDCTRHGITDPLYMEHQNAKRLFAKAQKIGKEVGMAKACQLVGLTLEGTHHRALDDALNVARLLPWTFGSRSIRDKRDPVF